MKKLVTLGCSWTAHYEPDGIGKGIDPWPTVIQKKKNWDVTNYGECGTGNWYGFTRLLEHIRLVGIPDSVYWLMTEMDRLDGVGDPNATLHITTYKRIVQGLNKNYKEKTLSLLSSKGVNLHPEYVEVLERTTDLCRILGENIDFQQVIDENLYYIRQMQDICREYNIELKIGMALHSFDSWSLTRSGVFSKRIINRIPGMMIGSRHFTNIDLSNIIGWPFLKDAGGMTIKDIKDWDKIYGLTPADNHPGQRGHNFIADIFLGEKKISDYK